MVYDDLTTKNVVAGKTMTITPKILVADDEVFNLDMTSLAQKTVRSPLKG
jgi:hypothetical protein